MKNLLIIEPIINSKDETVKVFVQKAVMGFFDELDFYISQNNDYDFLEYFLERTYLSMFTNGLVRNDTAKEITVVQEYGLTYLDNSYGRIDAFINYQNRAIFIEAKLQQLIRPISEDHWDIEAWINWDETSVRPQLIKYYETEERYSGFKSYSNCYLMTLIFKVLKNNSEEHFKNAKNFLRENHKNQLDRDWFYSVTSLKNIDEQKKLNGLEIYGTVEKRK